jgi:hypothetical protein
MAVDRLTKAEDKTDATKHLANVLANTTISTLMVVGIRKAMWAATGAVIAAILGRDRPEKEEPVKDFAGDVLDATVEYLPLGRVISGLVKKATGERTFDEIDPDAVLFGGPVALARGANHMRQAYNAYFEDGDDAKLKKELVAAANDIIDGISRLKGYPAGGILQLTTQPLERGMREKKSPGTIFEE